MSAPITVEREYYRNDIMWRHWTGAEFVRWWGYDDGNFWNKVSDADHWLVQTDKAGRRWRLDPRADTVTEVTS